ncbi:MAG: RNA polymerase sigma factor [Propionibacteriales bacterium]|nr:RNA polymerase sigma factor [Propionibacteriales bacterium]
MPSTVERLKSGSRAAMDELYREHADELYTYCYRRTGSWSAAEDLAASTFLEVWRSRRKVVEVDGSPRPWLYGVATNICRNHLRSQYRAAGALARLHLIDSSDSADPADDVASRIDADRRFQQTLDRVDTLTERDQEVFVLVLWEGLTYTEAAAALDIPVGTVRSRLARVRRQLRLATDQEELQP